jgi:hypothetical protein
MIGKDTNKKNPQKMQGNKLIFIIVKSFKTYGSVNKGWKSLKIPPYG